MDSMAPCYSLLNMKVKFCGDKTLHLWQDKLLGVIQKVRSLSRGESLKRKQERTRGGGPSMCVR